MSSMIGSRGLGGSTGTPQGQKLAGYDVARLQNFSPEQMQLFQNMFQHVSPESYTGRLSRGDEGLFREIEEPALRQFSGIQGNIASRFSGMGSGSRRSSGFQNTINQAGSDFAMDLQSRRQELMRSAIRDLQSMSSDLLDKKPYDQFLVEKQQKKPFWQQILAGGLPLAGAAVGGAFGGIPGAQLGGQLGGAAGQGFL